MAGQPIQDVKRRADELVGETTRHHGALLQALPGLLILTSQYTAAKRDYEMHHVRDEERRLLEALERKAVKRVLLMQDRYLVTLNQRVVEEQLTRINAGIAAVQVAIMIGKLAELYLGLATGIGHCKKIVDRAKLTIDTAKAGAAVARDNLAHRPVTTDAETMAQIVALVLKLSGHLDNTAKLVWDAAGEVRRVNSARHWAHKLSSVLNAVKILFDQVAVIDRYLMSDPTLAKNIGVAAGTLRDLTDAMRAGWLAGEAVHAILASSDTKARQLDEGLAYLGTERRILGVTHSVHSDPVEIVADAGDLASARLLLADVRREGERLLASINMAESRYWPLLTRLYAALVRLQPELDATLDCLQGLSAIIAELAFISARPGTAEAATMQASLTGYRTAVGATYLQVQSLLVPAHQVSGTKPPAAAPAW